jgi:hypothetical protein
LLGNLDALNSLLPLCTYFSSIPPFSGTDVALDLAHLPISLLVITEIVSSTVMVVSFWQYWLFLWFTGSVTTLVELS